MDSQAVEEVPIDFCTLGMFIIDEIHPHPQNPDQSVKTNIIGGAGTYSALGARLFSPAPTSSCSVGWIIDAGEDFPDEVRETIFSWQTAALIRPRNQGEATTRGWNGYSGLEHRAFKYLTPKKRLTADDLTPSLLAAKSFHLICSPLRCIDQVQKILERRTIESAEPRGNSDASARINPWLIWEPVPDLCIPEELENTLQALRYVDVISPNHDELASLFGEPHPERWVDRAIVEAQAHRLWEHGIGEDKQGAVIVRCGAMGCYVLGGSGRNRPDVDGSHQQKRWLPAYHTTLEKVVDPTGGGNGFLGGLAMGLVRYKDSDHAGDSIFIKAACTASIAASFCIEQVGVPVLRAAAEGKRETWNGDEVFDRLVRYNAELGP